MSVLYFGELNVNPERMLPFLDAYPAYGCWQSITEWKNNTRSHGYTEIPLLTQRDIKANKVAAVWNLLSPWDGLQSFSKIRKIFCNVPIIRQSQGGATPWWHKSGPRKFSVRTIPAYSFKLFKASLENSDGVMFNSEKYRECLIDQGVNIINKPYIIMNGMAFNKKLITGFSKKLSDIDGEPHVAIIGRALFNQKPFVENKIHLHYHYNEIHPDHRTKSKYVHIEKYLGDRSRIHKKVDIHKLLAWKKDLWCKTFSRYDAGIAHIPEVKDIDVYKGVDLHIPGKVNTYLAFGLPAIIHSRNSAIKDMLSPHQVSLEYEEYSDLVAKLKNIDQLRERQKVVVANRDYYSMQFEFPRVIEFMKTLGANI